MSFRDEVRFLRSTTPQDGGEFQKKFDNDWLHPPFQTFLQHRILMGPISWPCTNSFMQTGNHPPPDRVPKARSQNARNTQHPVIQVSSRSCGLESALSPAFSDLNSQDVSTPVVHRFFGSAPDRSGSLLLPRGNLATPGGRHGACLRNALFVSDPPW